jgi:mono/diheme cytochrome c family protein
MSSKRIPLEYAILAVAAAASFLVALPAQAQSAAVGSAETTAEKIARGKYIVTTSACHDCHTPWVMGPKGPEPDMTRALSGHPENEKLPPPPPAQGPWIMSAAATNTAWAGPWGISYTANLTPDRETGLGKWTQRNFVETIRTGRHMGRGREVLPPMPIQVYRNFTDADLAAVFAYLQSIPAIRNRVPEPLPPAAPVAAK